MKRIAFAARLMVAALVASLVSVPMGAGAAGVYENASAEPAFLLSPRRVTLRADIDFSRRDPTEASVYRLTGAFPLRAAFTVGLEQPFVSVSDSSGIRSGIGALLLRASATLHRGDRWSLSLLSYLATGTGTDTCFPYSSRSLDVSLSLAWADSVGPAVLYAIAGRTWVNREESGVPEDERQDDYWRGSAGITVDVGSSAMRGGVLYQDYAGDPQRTILYAGTGFDATTAIAFGVDFQTEVGPEAQRVSDWAGSASVTIRF
jgi:hypothetical protein